MRPFPIILLAALLGASCGPGRQAPYDASDGNDGTADGDDGGLDADGQDDGDLDDGSPDGADGGDPAADGDPGSRCQPTAIGVSCAHDTAALNTGASGQTIRQVHWQVPLGEPPPDGWPVAIFFQGSLFSAQGAWSGVPGEIFGIYHQVLTFCSLLDAGYAVLAPETHLGGTTFWDSNLPAWAWNWEAAPDHYFMLSILEAIEAGRFGPLDDGRLFAFGFSSGGYMASRVGIAYPGRFLALAIHSASYATCSAAICSVPTDLPGDHPPVLFLHGILDATVPEWTMRLYERALADLPVATRVITSALHGHEWLPDAPAAIADWFDEYR